MCKNTLNINWRKNFGECVFSLVTLLLSRTRFEICQNNVDCIQHVPIPSQESPRMRVCVSEGEKKNSLETNS